MTRQHRWLTARVGRQAARRLAMAQHGVVSRRQLVAGLVPRWVVRAEVVAGRWQRVGRQVVVLHNGPLTTAQQRWTAVLGTCPRAALDGVTALQEAGVTGLRDETVHVIAPKGSQPRRSRGVTVHESRRFQESDVVDNGIRRMRPAVAAVHAALWAVSDRQAQLFLLMVVQQRKATPEQLLEVVETVRRHPRRRLLRRLIGDLAGGVQSLGELDVAEDFRRRGFPEPDRQEIRSRPSGAQYLDCELAAYALVLEIDGAGHEDPAQKLGDLLRDIEVATDGQTVVRIPLALYHLGREQVLDRIEGLLLARGWTPPALAS